MQALMDGVVLAVHGQNRRRRARRGRSVTMPPAMTRISLLASAIVLPSSMAARTASSASVPADAHSTRSASGCDATATSPSRPVPRDRHVRADAQPASRSIAAPVAMATTAGRYRAICAAKQLRVLAGREADDLQSIGMRVHDRQRALPD